MKIRATRSIKLQKTYCMRSPPLCSPGCPEARCYWHEEAALRSLASTPPCLQPPPSTQTQTVTSKTSTLYALWTSVLCLKARVSMHDVYLRNANIPLFKPRCPVQQQQAFSKGTGQFILWWVTMNAHRDTGKSTQQQLYPCTAQSLWALKHVGSLHL